MSEPLPITATITQFCKLVHIPRTRVYQLLKDGELESVMLGRRRMILCDSYIELIRRLRNGGNGGGEDRG